MFLCHLLGCRHFSVHEDMKVLNFVRKVTNYRRYEQIW